MVDQGFAIDFWIRCDNLGVKLGMEFIDTKTDDPITYIPTKTGWTYLAVVMDLFSGRIVGWAMSDNIDSKLVQSTMKMAILHPDPGTGLIYHSDRGVQYAAQDFHDLLEDNKVICSMSRKGNCWDYRPFVVQLMINCQAYGIEVMKQAAVKIGIEKVIKRSK